MVGIAVILPTALMYTAIGLLCGTLVSDKAGGGICGAMLTTVSFILSGLTIPLTVMGHAFQTIAQTLPFYHAANGECGHSRRLWPHLAAHVDRPHLHGHIRRGRDPHLHDASTQPVDHIRR